MVLLPHWKQFDWCVGGRCDCMRLPRLTRFASLHGAITRRTPFGLKRPWLGVIVVAEERNWHLADSLLLRRAASDPAFARNNFDQGGGFESDLVGQ